MTVGSARWPGPVDISVNNARESPARTRLVPSLPSPGSSLVILDPEGIGSRTPRGISRARFKTDRFP
jgi:hypothetical protein